MEGRKEKSGYNVLAIIASTLIIPPVIIWASAFLYLFLGVGLFSYITNRLPLDNVLSEIAIFLGFPIASLVLGIISYRQIVSRGEEGKILSVIAIIFGVLFIIFIILASLRAS